MSLNKSLAELPSKELALLADEIAPYTQWRMLGLAFESSHGFVIQEAKLQQKYPAYLSSGGNIYLCNKLLEELGSQGIKVGEMIDALDREPINLKYLASKYRQRYSAPPDSKPNPSPSNPPPNNNNEPPKPAKVAEEKPNFENEAWYKKEVPTAIEIFELSDIPKIQVSIFVVNDIEYNAVLREFHPLEGKDCVATVETSNRNLGFFYKVGRFGAVNASLTQTPMGQRAEPYISATIQDFKPRVCFYIGVGWGADEQTQQLGDVMVSEQVAVFGVNDKAQGGVEASREVIHAAGQVVLNLLKNYKASWKFTWNDKQFKPIFGRIMSGGLLLNDAEKKAELMTRSQNHMVPIIGGDMEAASLANSIFNNLTDIQQWVMVKGICDWADGNKHAGYQPLAAATATSFVLHALQNEKALKNLLA